MFGLEIAAVGLLHFTGLSERKAAEARARADGNKAAAIKSIKCEPVHDLDIKIAPTQDPIQYDFSKNIEQLGAIGSGAYSPYGAEHKTNLLGLTNGRHELNLQSRFMTQTYEQLDRGCVHIKEVVVKMNFAPTVYVVSEFPKGTCEFNNVLRHEKEHVKITQQMLNKYSKILGKHLKASLKGGYSFGPFKTRQIPQAQEKLTDKIAKIAVDVNKQMNAEMEKHQNRFDRAEKESEALDACAKAKNSARSRR